MDCKHKYQEDKYDENLGCFHKVTLCKLNLRACQGTEGVCSKFALVEEKLGKKEEKPIVKPEQKPEKKGGK